MKIAAIGLLVVGLSCGTLAGCARTPDSAPAVGDAEINIDGSSTVFPITEKAVNDYRRRNSQASIAVDFSGSGGGFKKFCAGETDVNNASRPINEEELAACAASGIDFIEVPVAFDALTVVVHSDNTWADEITLAELKTLWEPTAEGRVTRWNQVRATWPDEEIVLFGPGVDSGTFDYFTEAVVGEAGASRRDYTDSEDDDELVVGVSENPNALGYFGLAYYARNHEILKSLAVDGGLGPVQPTPNAVVSGEYFPLGRPLLLYINKASLESKSDLEALLKAYLGSVRNWVPFVGYVPLPPEAYELALARVEQRKLGTVFGGQIEPGLSIEEVLRRESP